MKLPKLALRIIMTSIVLFLTIVTAMSWLRVHWWWRAPTAQVLIGDRLDVHAAVYLGRHGDRLIYIPSSDTRAVGSGFCYVAPKAGGAVTWAGAAPPYRIALRPTFVVMAGGALEKPDAVTYPIEKFESDVPFRHLANGVEFEDDTHEKVRVYW